MSRFLSAKTIAGFLSIFLLLVMVAGFLGILPFSKTFQGDKAYAQDIPASSMTRAELEQELDKLSREIDDQQKVLDKKKNERVSLERDVSILNAEITQAKLSIRARGLTIDKLSQEINSKKKVIGVLSTKIDKEKAILAELLRRLNEADSYSDMEVLLSGRQLSSFFENNDSYQVIKDKLKDSYDLVSDVKEDTEKEKADLEDKKNDQVGLLKIQELQKKRIEENEAEKKRILVATKGQEKEYQKVLKEKQKNAEAIRTALFNLRGSGAISFDKAYAMALKVEAKTGVRPALLLGIIAEESNLGENVGTGNWKVDMKAPRDTVPFMDICQRLGLDPDKMPVSKKPWYGYGGAMGPAQFIPSTWVTYEKRIAELTGVDIPNPWNPEHAFMAAGVLMKENGADKRTFATERLAALRYLAGWNNASKKAYAFYGDDVMALAEKYQKQIDIIK